MCAGVVNGGLAVFEGMGKNVADWTGHRSANHDARCITATAVLCTFTFTPSSISCVHSSLFFVRYSCRLLLCMYFSFMLCMLREKQVKCWCICMYIPRQKGDMGRGDSAVYYNILYTAAVYDKSCCTLPCRNWYLCRAFLVAVDTILVPGFNVSWR